MAWMWIWWILGLALVFLVAWAIARAAVSSRPTSDSAETILKRRYAAGEIDWEEYEQRLSDIRK